MPLDTFYLHDRDYFQVTCIIFSVICVSFLLPLFFSSFILTVPDFPSLYPYFFCILLQYLQSPITATIPFYSILTLSWFSFSSSLFFFVSSLFFFASSIFPHLHFPRCPQNPHYSNGLLLFKPSRPPFPPLNIFYPLQFIYFSRLFYLFPIILSPSTIIFPFPSYIKSSSHYFSISYFPLFSIIPHCLCAFPINILFIIIYIVSVIYTTLIIFPVFLSI